MYPRKPLNSVAYEHLMKMIYNRELSFDTIYSETRLASELSISRTPMRDALNQLAFERYIDILPNRGFMLHRPDAAELTEAYHVRMMIEVYCGEAIARHYPEAKARAAVARMEDALEQQRVLLEHDDADRLNQFWAADLAFHRASLEFFGFPSFLSQYNSYVHMFMPHYMVMKGAGPAELERAVARRLSTLSEHAAIVEALCSRSAERVRPAIQAHLDSSMAVYAVEPTD